ncbi:MAG: PAS domain S-box protein [Bacteroidetes bacterium]|nr:PAS domain S-box protein [Bacteroidota bacterium]
MLEEQLREKTEANISFNLLLSNLDGMVYRCRNDEFWTMEFISQGCFELTGFYDFDFIKNQTKTFIEIIHPEDREMVRTTINEAILKKEKFKIIYRIITATGIEKWVLERGSGVWDNQNNLQALEGVIGDFSDIKSAEKIQKVIYNISDAANSSESLEDLYKTIHIVLEELMNTENFYIALYDSEKNIINFPYFVDKYDEIPEPRPLGNGLTDLVIKKGEAFLGDWKAIKRLYDENKLSHIGQEASVWLGVPLKAKGKIIGVLTVQSYNKSIHLGEKEKEILTFISEQIAMAIEQKRAEKALKDSEAKYRLLAELSNDIIWTVSLDLKYTYISPSIFLQRGYTQEEFLNLPLEKIYTEESLNLVKSTFSREIGYVLQGIITDKDYSFTTELEDLCKDGTKKWGEVNTRPIWDENGKISGIHGITRDITERRKTQDALIESEHQFRVLVSNLPEVVMVYKNNTIVFVNDYMKVISGYEPKELIGENIFKFIPNKYWPIIKLNIEKRSKGEKIIPYEIEVIIKSGEKIIVLISADVVNLNNEPSFLVVLSDITKRKLEEEDLKRSKLQAESANKAKSDFLAMMSHEIRTPMNGVIGMTDLLQRTHLNNDQQDYVETIKICSESLLSIINEILDFSKIEYGKMELDSAAFDLSKCVKDSFGLLELKAQEKNIRLGYLIDDEVWSCYEGDILRLRQILVNILNNAIKYTEKGSIELNVKLLNDNENFQKIQFSIKDTGIGIAPDKKELLFNPFFQIDSSTTRKHGGTGLGLVICQRLVRMMDGEIWVESTLGNGSEFFFTVQLKKSNLCEFINFENDVMSELIDKKALIHTNSALNTDILKTICTSIGMQIETTEEIDNFEENPFKNLDLLDLLIFDFSGFSNEKIASILEYTNKFNTPIVLVSSSFIEIENEKNENYHFIQKPFSQISFKETLFRVFSEKETEIIEDLDEKLSLRIPLKILVAEDNVINQKMVLKLLQYFGYSADVVENGEDAIRAIENNNFDIIFMDVHMPIKDGLEATKEIINNPEIIKKPIIIAITANAMFGDRDICLKAGMSDYLCKPVRLDEIKRILEFWGPIK